MKVFIILSVIAAFFVSTDGIAFGGFFESLNLTLEPPKPSDVHPHGTPLSIMTFTTNHSVTVNYDEIDKIFLQKEVINRKIVVISIIGAFRKGKSFFMDYCLRFMYAHYKSVNFPNNTLANKSDWIGSPEAPLIGFSWKAGPHRHTSGIVMWSDVFLHEDLAIILMDTQGLFDAKTSPADNSRIFALGTLVSSFQIFNLNDVIQENQLEYLQMATDYAKFATNSSGGSTGTPFQSLLFLMRDWASSHAFSYGFGGGQLYLGDVLQIKNDQSPELRDVRNYIMASFEEVLCFLMPHPGLGVVSDKTYDGRFSRLDHKFQDNLKHLLEWMFDSKNLKKKVVLGSEVTGRDFNGYFKSYFETFQSPDAPKIPSIYEATVERQLANYVEKSMSHYKTGIEEFKPNFTSKNFSNELEDIHNKLKTLVITQYKAARKMGSREHDKQYEDILVKDIEDYYMQWHKPKVDTHNRLVEVEAENQRKIIAAQKIADAKLLKETERLKADKIQSEKEAAERLLKLEQNLKLKDEERLEAIQKIQNDNLAIQKKANQALVEMKNAHEIERQRIAVEIAERERNTQEELKRLKIDREKENAAIQLQLQRDSEIRLEQRKKDADEKKEMRRMEQERLDREDAYRKEQLELLRMNTDAESIERKRQLDLEEKRRVKEKEEREEERKHADALRRQDLADREQERQDMMMQFAQQIQGLAAVAQRRMDQEAAARKAEEEKREFERMQIQAARDAEIKEREMWSELEREEREKELSLQREREARRGEIRQEELNLLRAQLAREQQEREERWKIENDRYQQEKEERALQRAMEAEQLEAERVERQRQRQESQQIFMQRMSMQRR